MACWEAFSGKLEFHTHVTGYSSEATHRFKTGGRFKPLSRHSLAIELIAADPRDRENSELLQN